MKKFKSMKRWLGIALLLLSSASAHAQFLRSSYFMEGTHYRMQLNPALAPGRGYINIPAIGSLNATVNSSSLGYQDIIDNSEDADFFTSQNFINRLDNMNHLNVNLSTDIISAGWYKGRNFWSFNIGLRNDIGASIPRSMFEFLDKTNNVDKMNLAKLNEEVTNQSLRINSYAEVGLGFSRNITDRLTVGGRLKALLGIANTKLNIDRISVASNITGWDGKPESLNYEQAQNLRGRADINVEATLESSSKLLELQQSTNEAGRSYIDKLDFGSFGFSGFGGAIDLGASFKLTKRLTLSASC